MEELIDFSNCSTVTDMFLPDFDYFKGIDPGTKESFLCEWDEYAEKLKEVGGTPTLVKESQNPWKGNNPVVHIQYNPPLTKNEDTQWIGAKASELATKAKLLKIKPTKTINYFGHINEN